MTLIEFFKTKTEEEILEAISKDWYLSVHMSNPRDFYGEVYDQNLCVGCKHRIHYSAGPTTITECALSYPCDIDESCPFEEEQKKARMESIKEFLHYWIEG